MSARRVLLRKDASSAWRKSLPAQEPWLEPQGYPARWIHPPGPGGEVAFTVFELSWISRRSEKLLVHASADERYHLFFNGRPLGEGPERSHCSHWKFESYQLGIPAGSHRLTAVVWSLGPARPWAQTSLRHGFILWPEKTAQLGRFATGSAPWRCRVLTGIELVPPDPELRCVPGGGPGFAVDAHRRGNEAWQPAVVGDPARRAESPLYPGRAGHALEPAELPPQQNRPLPSARALCACAFQGRNKNRRFFQPQNQAADASAWGELWSQGKKLRLPPRRTFAIVWDLGRYDCGRPLIALEAPQSLGAHVEFLVVETPFDGPEGFVDKSRRDEIWGKNFRGITDRFTPDASARGLQEFSPFWWRAGRYLLLRIFTGTQGLVLHRVGWTSTGYPLRLAIPRVEDPALKDVLNTSAHTLQMCSHETYMDCPYYEQLMYAGDGRIECLLTYCSSADTRLPAKALRLFDQSRANSRALPTDAVPGNNKIIPPFALWWVSMIHDFALWHGNRDFIHALLPGARQVADLYLAAVDRDGLAHQLEGWNFYDWCWPGGIPPGGMPGETSALLQWHLILVLQQLRDLEIWCGGPDRARVWQLAAQRLFNATDNFWSTAVQLYADTDGGPTYSQHVQSLALLAGNLSPARSRHLLRALHTPSADITRAGGYFTHYVFEALLAQKCTGAFLAGLKPWHDALAAGFTTFPETFGATRSDCHAWNAHPLYHVVSGVAGLRPAELGGRRWLLNPALGSLPGLQVRIPRDAGAIEVEFTRRGPRWNASLTVPAWAEIRFVHHGRGRLFRKGHHRFQFAA